MLPRILHKAYQIYLPAVGDDARPRVATYIRKHNLPWSPVARTQDTRGSKDLLIIDLLASGGQKLRLINLYSAPGGTDGAGAGVDSLLSLDDTDIPCLMAGDFNLHHELWATRRSATRPTARAEALVEHMMEHGWELGLEAGTITRPSISGGSALDLVILNMPLEDTGWVEGCDVRPELAVGSDHWPISTTLRCGAGPPLERELRFRFDRADWDKFREGLRATLGSMVGPLIRPSSEQATNPRNRAWVDALAAAMQNWLRSALLTAVPRTSTTGQGHPWWSPDCTKASKALSKLERELAASLATGLVNLPLLEATERARKATKQVLDRARRQYYRDKTETIQGNEIFAARKWAQAERKYASPALRDEAGTLYVTLHEKRSLLQATLLPDREREDPLSVLQALPIGPSRATHTPIARAELRKALWSVAPEKAPGPDEITGRVLREGWAVIEEPLFELTSAAFDLGWFPEAFKDATLCALRKPGKRDPTLARSYRLISLLSVLGKVLEKLATARLTYFAEDLKLVPIDQFGAMPKRCAADAGMALVHDVHVGWTSSTRLTTSVLFFDVVGAFDNVDPGRMVRRLWDFGLPLQLVSFIASWLASRRAAIRLDASTGPLQPCSTGLPQGSPLSMILFVLFLAPLWDSIPRDVRLFGYVDDGALRVQGSSVQENCTALERAYQAAQEWATENELWFDSVKRELIHFPPRSRPPAELHPVSLGPDESDTIMPVQRDAAVRWLGIHFNPSLDWSHHVRKVCGKARAAVSCLKMLANTIRGPSAALLRRAYVACILPIFTFAAAVWWYDLVRQVGGRTIRVGGAKKLLNLAQLVQNQALRIILPVWRTTPVQAMQIEASLPPVELLLSYLRDRYAVRLRDLPQHHPLSLRLRRRVPPSDSANLLQVRRSRRHPSTPLLELAKLSSKVASDGSLPQAPWAPSVSQLERVTLTSAAGSTREQATLDHQQLISGMADALLVYTDGSMQTNGSTRQVGAGWVMYKDGRRVFEYCVHFFDDCEVFDAEVSALYGGISTALVIARNTNVHKIAVFADNAAAIRAVDQEARANTSSHGHLQQIRDCIRGWVDTDTANEFSLHWVPSHTGIIIGNERADIKAKQGTSALRADSRATKRTVSLSTARRRAKDKLLRKWAAEWNRGSKHRSYRRLHTQIPSFKPAAHLGTMPRKTLGQWLQVKTGHGNFCSYHQRPEFHHPDARLECRCGRPNSRLHPLVCDTFQRHQPLLDSARLPSGRLDYQHLFNEQDGIDLFAEYANVSRCYDRERWA